MAIKRYQHKPDARTIDNNTHIYNLRGGVRVEFRMAFARWIWIRFIRGPRNSWRNVSRLELSRKRNDIRV